MFWPHMRAGRPEVLAVGLQHMVAGAHDSTVDGQPHTGLHPGTLYASLHLCAFLPNKLSLLCSAPSLQRWQEYDRQEGWNGGIMSSCVLLGTGLITLNTANTMNEGKRYLQYISHT